MGGAIKTVSHLASEGFKPIYEVPKAVVTGGSLNDITQAAGVKHFMNEVGVAKTAIMGEQAQPDAPPDGPAGPTPQQLAQQQADAARNAEVNLRKDRPGRSQTILSDNSAYPYQLV